MFRERAPPRMFRERAPPRMFRERALDRREVQVRDDRDTRLREPRTVHDRGVVERIADDQVLGAGQGR